MNWLVIAVVGAVTMVFKASGPVLLAARELPARVASVVDVLAPAMLAALVAAAITIVLLPFAPPGVPIVAASLAALIGLRR